MLRKALKTSFQTYIFKGNRIKFASWTSCLISGLSLAFNKKLYGQHLVNGPVIKHLRGHTERQPHRPLVLSFHGPTGTGKNYATSLIADNLYVKGMGSQYVHYFQTTRDFIHKDRASEYKVRISSIKRI